MVSSLALSNKTKVVLNDGDKGFLNLPFADVAEGFTTDRSLLGGLRGCPTICPVVSELLDERGLNRGRL
jgi:hypothetical protein